MRKLKLVLEYEGTNYHGWQKQENAPAVQNLLEDRLKVLLKEPVSTIGAGRTDTGVHARMQVVSFSTASPLDTARLARGLNGLLPRDIRVTACEEAPQAFSARRDPLRKTYHYRLLNRQADSPFWRRFAWHLPEPLDVEAMRQAGACLVGDHDFSSFRAASCEAEHARRRLMEARVDQEGELLVVKLTATAFLHHMARIIAGTLVETGQGRRKPGDMKALLEARDRRRAGKTAPARGLILWEVVYGAIPRPKA